MDHAFDDVFAANRAYAADYRLAGLAAPAARGLAVLTCIDSRLEPLQMLGLAPGDAKILRNAGARATDDALRSLVLATNLLEVRRVLVVAHTDCAMDSSDDELRHRLSHARPGADVSCFEPHAATDQLATLEADVERIRRSPLLAPGVVVAGCRYDVDTGELHHVIE